MILKKSPLISWAGKMGRFTKVYHINTYIFIFYRQDFNALFYIVFMIIKFLIKFCYFLLFYYLLISLVGSIKFRKDEYFIFRKRVFFIIFWFNFVVLWVVCATVLINVHAVIRKQKNLKWAYKYVEDGDCKLDFIKDLNIYKYF